MNTWASGALGGDIGGGTAVEAATGLTELLQWDISYRLNIGHLS